MDHDRLRTLFKSYREMVCADRSPALFCLLFCRQRYILDGPQESFSVPLTGRLRRGPTNQIDGGQVVSIFMH